YLHHIPRDAVTIPAVLRENGYQTWHVGKWHLGTEEYYPEVFGYDVNIGGCWWGHPQKGYFSPWGIETLPDGPEGEYLTDRLTDEAIRLIQSADERPFYLDLWHYVVHTPIQAKEADIRYFERKARRLGLDRAEAIVAGEKHPTVEHGNHRVMRRTLQSDCAYAAMILNLDENIGRLVEALKAAGRFENTLIVFTSDNGGLSTAEGSPTCNLPAIEGKGWIYEGGTRVPMFAVWSGVIPCGTHTEVPVHTPDFFPTFLEAAGIAPKGDQPCDGVSLMPVLRGKSIPERALYWHYPHYGNQGGRPASSVILGRWKLIEFYEDHHLELYDLENDISEQRNLATEKAELAQQLKLMLQKWLDSVGAKYPTPNAQMR
ncbi:MAG: sulfatase, partial [Clostridia bacterium]|nr:sulfatase [Clostridia bacterium]